MSLANQSARRSVLTEPVSMIVSDAYGGNYDRLVTLKNCYRDRPDSLFEMEGRCADALRMARAGRHVALHTTSGLGHRRVLKDPGVHAAICDHVRGAVMPDQPLALVEDCA